MKQVQLARLYFGPHTACLKVVDEAEVDGLMDADSYEEICPQQ